MAGAARAFPCWLAAATLTAWCGAANGQSLTASDLYDQALEEVERSENEYERKELLAAIGASQARSGRLAAAKRTYAMAGAAAVSHEWFRYLEARRVAALQLAIGDIDGALKTVQGIEEISLRGMGLRPVALAQIEAGDLHAALRTARSIARSDEGQHRTSMRSDTFADLARAQGAAGNMANARESLREVADLSDRALVLAAIATAQARSGETTAARKLFAELDRLPLPATGWRELGGVYETLSVALAARGDFVGATEVAEAMLRPERTMTECAIAAAYRETGRTATADRLAAVAVENTPSTDSVASSDPGLFVKYARAMHMCGNRDRARAHLATAFQRVPLDEQYCHQMGSCAGLFALEGIAELQIVWGDLDGALETASKMQHAYYIGPNPRTTVFRRIFEAYRKVGKLDGMLTAARQHEGTIDRRAFGIFRLDRAIDTMISEGRFVDADRIADAIQEKRSQAWALGRIAIARAAAEDISRAGGDADRIRKISRVDEVMRTAIEAPGGAKRLDLESDKDLAAWLKKNVVAIPAAYCAEIYAIIGRIQAAVGDRTAARQTFGQALQAAGTTTRPATKVAALISVAEWIPDTWE